jgi:hypothetical protein
MAGCPGRYRRASWCGSPNRGEAKAAGRGSCACRPLPLQLYPAGAAPVLGPDTEEAATTQPIGRCRFAVASYENRQQRDAPVSPTSRLAQSRSGAGAGHTPSMPAPLIELPADDRDRAAASGTESLASPSRPRPTPAGFGWQTDTPRPAPRNPRARTGPRRHRLPALLHRRRPSHHTRARPRSRRLDHPPRRSVGRVPGLRGQPVRASRRARSRGLAPAQSLLAEAVAQIPRGANGPVCGRWKSSGAGAPSGGGGGGLVAVELAQVVGGGDEAPFRPAGRYAAA